MKLEELIVRKTAYYNIFIVNEGINLQYCTYKNLNLT